MSDGADQNELGSTMASVQHHHSKAAEEIATGRVSDAEYHLLEAYLALDDYLMEGDQDSGPERGSDD